MLKITLSANQCAKVSIQPQGPNWEPEPLDGPPLVRVVSGDVIARIDDGNTLVIIPNEPGVSLLEISGDAAEGSEVDVISEQIEVTVIHPRAVRITFGIPVLADKSTVTTPEPAAPAPEPEPVPATPPADPVPNTPVASETASVPATPAEPVASDGAAETNEVAPAPAEAVATE